MPRRILVVGGLAAGPSAASKAARTNPEAEVTLFEQGNSISYGICEIPYFIAGEVEAEGLVAYTPESMKKEKGVDVRILHRVEEIVPRKRSIVVRNLANGTTSEERYDRLIVATGSRVRPLGVKGESSRNVFHVKSLEDGHNIRKLIRDEHPARAVIIGGGYVGMEMADALRKCGMEVIVLHRHALPMAGLEPATREMAKKVLEEQGVRFIPNVTTEGFLADAKQLVTHVHTSAGTFEAGLVILAMGVTPNSELARNAGIRCGVHGGILTDARQQTSLDNVFAAGDCCEVKNLVTNKWTYLPLATIASKAGWTAGENAAGGKAVFRGAIRAIAVRVFDTEFARVGVGTAEAEAAGFAPVTETITGWSKVAVMPGSKRLTITTIADKKSGRLLGANVYGKEGAVLRANTLAVGIQHHMTIDEIQQWDLAYSPPFSPLWDPILVAANATAKKVSMS